jgi:hypothetical protein
MSETIKHGVPPVGYCILRNDGRRTTNAVCAKDGYVNGNASVIVFLQDLNRAAGLEFFQCNHFF